MPLYINNAEVFSSKLSFFFIVFLNSAKTNDELTKNLFNIHLNYFTFYNVGNLHLGNFSTIIGIISGYLVNYSYTLFFLSSTVCDSLYDYYFYIF